MGSCIRYFMISLLLLGFLPSFGFPATFRGAFGNSTVAFLIFTFMLVYPLSQTSFVRRCTVSFITNSFARRGPWSFITFLFAAVTFMGLFISPSVLFVAFMTKIPGCLIPDTTYLHKDLVVSDIIYEPKETALLKMAKETGCQTFNGTFMKIVQ